MEVTDEHVHHARIIWDYLQLKHTPIPADLIIALGTNDLRVAEFAADLYHRGFARKLLCSGGVAHQGDLLATKWDRTEAEMYADIAVARGVPREDILLERRATNTSENIRLSRALVEGDGLAPKNVLLVVKPFMGRRTWAHMAVEWPEMPASIASPRMQLEEYFTAELTPWLIINIMVGDLERLQVYGARGWAAPPRVPAEVLAAFESLKAGGFTRHLIGIAG